MQLLDSISIGRPVTRGPVSLFPLYTHGARQADYVPGPVAADTALFQIDEEPGASVASLVATVTGTTPVLLVEGETFTGGLQNRVLNVTVLLAPGTHQVPVACVEAARWGARSQMGRAGVRAPRRVRRVKNESVHEARRMHGEAVADQGAVWASVDDEIAEIHAAAPTRALHDAYAHAVAEPDDTAPAIEALVRLGPLPGQAGVVVAAGGRCLTADLFDRPETLAVYWGEILRSHLLDCPDRIAARPSLGTALRFVRRLKNAEQTESQGVGLGRERHYRDKRVVAQGLEHDDALVHLSVVAA